MNMRFRLVTYNIHKGIGGTDRRYRLERVIETLRHCEPDIALLQEVDEGVPRSKHDRQVELLSEALGLRYHAFQRNVQLKYGSYGNAILSRFPLVDVSDFDLTVRYKKRRRALLAHCRVHFGRHTRLMLVANIHLGLSGIERQIQLRRLLKDSMIARVSRQAPLVIGGDYNDVWGTLGNRMLRSEGLTSVSGKTRTFPAIMPLRPLDRIYYRNLVQPRHAFASRTRVARVASDHLPLIADMEITI